MYVSSHKDALALRRGKLGLAQLSVVKLSTANIAIQLLLLPYIKLQRYTKR